MAKAQKPILRDYLYVPAEQVDKRLLDKHFTVMHFNEKGCKPCEYRSERPCDTCFECPNFYGTYKFFRRKTIDDKKYIGLATGRQDLIEKVVDSYDKKKVIDERANVPMKQPLDFILDLRPVQVTATDAMEKFTNGVLQAPPRTGKTVMSIKMICAKKQRTLVIAHQDDLLDQFLLTIYGQEPDFPRATNAKKLDKKRDSPIAIVAKKDSDFFSDAEIVMTTYQKFIRPKGMKLLRKIAKNFGTVVVDEIHKGNADTYARVLSYLKPKFLYTVTATPERKDGKEFIVDRIVGPIRHKVDAETMTPEVIVQKSAMNTQVRAKQWTAIVKSLYRHPKRNMDIVNWVMKDLKAGHSILIPATQRWYIQAMVEEINKAWMAKTGSNKEIAAPFYSMKKQDKQDTLNKARDGKIRVVVAMRSMLTGVNVPRWSAIYELSPINNPPNFEQETKRVCTPFEGKKPIIRFFVDEKCNPSVRCFLACVPVMQKLKYRIPKDAWKEIKRIQEHSGSYQDSEYTGGRMSIGMPGKRLSL